MKTLFLSRLIATAILFIACLALPSNMQAQGTTCGTYMIQNGLNCTIKVQYNRTCNGNPCGSAIISIPPLNTVPIPACSCPGGVCDVKTTLISVNGTPISPMPSVSSANFSASFSDPCSNTTKSMNWHTAITVIH